ncbi:hypothetical protein K523DRAFT_311400 [Schizophyllum commune Tattone D]|nr:hypothetical protein K523DRAFT_311400 [Schizophyllum commune Tattone D]
MSRPRAHSPPVIMLYDVPGSTPQPWAPNIWRIRFILNYKRLRYRTIWVEFPDVEPTLRSLGAPPSARRPDGRSVYTLPVIVDPTPAQAGASPVILSNATTIAEYLETRYPARAVFPEGSRALQTLFVHHVQETLARSLLPVMVPLSHERLPPRTQVHYSGAGRGAGSPAEREAAWAAVRAEFDFLAGVLDKNTGDGDGDAVVAQGHDVSYADFALCAVLVWMERMAPHDGWARVRGWNGGRWARLWERCRPYMDEF